jgi:hypothetical protein
VVEARPRRPVDPALLRELSDSPSYGALCERLAYSEDPETPFPYGASSPVS